MCGRFDYLSVDDSGGLFFLDHMIQGDDVDHVKDEADDTGGQDEHIALDSTEDGGGDSADTLADGDQHGLTLAGFAAVQHIQVANAHGDVL